MSTSSRAHSFILTEACSACRWELAHLAGKISKGRYTRGSLPSFCLLHVQQRVPENYDENDLNKTSHCFKTISSKYATSVGPSFIILQKVWFEMQKYGLKYYDENFYVLPTSTNLSLHQIIFPMVIRLPFKYIISKLEPIYNNCMVQFSHPSAQGKTFKRRIDQVKYDDGKAVSRNATNHTMVQF